MKEFFKENRNYNFKINFNSKIKKTFKFLYKPALFIVLLQSIFLIFFLYDNNQQINPKIRRFVDKEMINIIGLSFDTIELDDYKEYFSDLFRSIFSRKQIKVFDLNLSFRDKQKLECMRLKKENCSKDGWVRSELVHDNKTYKVKLRAKGDRDIHKLKFNKMSFKVDIRGEERLFGMEEFSIQLPIIRNYTIEAVAADLLRKEDIISPRNFYISLYINGEYVGVRHIEETMSRELVESSKKRYGPVFTKPLFEDFVLNDKKNWHKNNSNLDNEAITVIKTVWENPTLFNKYFDIDKWAKYMSLLDLMMMIHGTVPKSVKYYLNPTTGLIEPVFFDGHNGGWFNNYRISDALTKNNEELKFPNCTLTCNQLDFYRMMFGSSYDGNIEFYEKYFNYLDKYSRNEFFENSFTKEWEKYWLERGTIYREFSKKDKTFKLGIMPHIGGKQKLYKRFQEINKEIRKSNNEDPKHSFSKNKNYLEVENINSRLPQIYTLYCKSKKIDEILLVKNTKRKLNLLNFQNCMPKDLSYKLNNENKFKYIINQNWIDIDLQNKIIQQENIQEKELKELIFDKKSKNINTDLSIANKKITFKDGTKLCLNNSSILRISNSIIIFEGNDLNPVIVNGCDKGNGSFLIENSILEFNNIIISNLIAPNLKLRSLDGGLNIINSEIKGNKLHIKNSLSEDAVNFINSKFLINEVNLNNIQSDGLDADFSEFKIYKVNCESIGNDCVDFSYSEGELNELNANRVRDKAISLGENSILNMNKVFVKNSEIGITAKDLSNLKINNYEFEETLIPVAAFIKKPELGKPSIKIKRIKPTIFRKEFISKDSFLTINDERIIGEYSSKQVADKLYGKQFGVKTIR